MSSTFFYGRITAMKHDGPVRTALIAEIGTSHNGDFAHACALIDEAKEAGADFAKFQIVYADEILHPDTGFVDLPGGRIRLYDRFRELETDPEFYGRLSEYCESAGIAFLCTPFGLRSARELIALSPTHIKIASPELNHLPLLDACAKSGLPLILSSGVSTLADIERALECTAGAKERILLHCVTSYPAPEEDYNLQVLESLSAVFGVRVGVSDHSLDPILVPVLSVACGGTCIEKHITLSKTGSGLDDPVALTAEQFAEMVRAVRQAETQTKEEIVHGMELRYGERKVRAVLGDGVKRLAPSEKANYARTNRSIHFLRSMKKGERIGERDIALLRTEKVLNPGLGPEFLERAIGSVLVRDVQDGAGLEWEDLLAR